VSSPPFIRPRPSVLSGHLITFSPTLLPHALPQVTCLQWHPSGSHLCYIEDGDDLSFLSYPPAHTTGPSVPIRLHNRALSLRRCGDVVASAGEDSILSLWDGPTMTCARSIYRHNFPIISREALALAPNGRHVAYSIDDVAYTSMQVRRRAHYHTCLTYIYIT
jgi:WD40 repeat protein